MNMKNILKLIDKHFPCSSKLHKIFSHNTVGVSYSSTPNFQQIIKRHNKKLTKRKEQKTADSKHRAESPFYKCVTKSNNIPPKKTYFGTSEKAIGKKRYCNHTKRFKNLKYSIETNLSGFLWDLTNKNIPAPHLQWPIEKRFQPIQTSLKD